MATYDDVIRKLIEILKEIERKREASNYEN